VIGRSVAHYRIIEEAQAIVDAAPGTGVRTPIQDKEPRT
jgi:hypothetical protein